MGRATLRLLIILFLIYPLLANADVIPSTRRYDWRSDETVGVLGGFNQYRPGGGLLERTNLIDVTESPYSADNTGATDAKAAIQSAIDAGASNDVIYLPAGTYRLDSNLSFDPAGDDYLTMRGAGMGQTILDIRSTAYGIFAGSQSDYNWVQPGGSRSALPNVIYGEAGATNLTISSTNSFAIGNVCMIMQSNDVDQATAIDVKSVYGINMTKSQMVRVTGVPDASTIQFWPPLRWSCDTNRGVKIARTTQVLEGVGFENFSINGTNTQVSGGGIALQQAFGNWIYNVETKYVGTFQLRITDTINSSVHGWYGNDIRPDKLISSGNAALIVYNSSNLLVENNRVYHNFPGFEINGGCSGNVFGYNLIYHNYQGPYTPVGTELAGNSIDSNHDPHNSFNLYEGNVCQMFQADGYQGGVSDDTVFRNWFTGTNSVLDQNLKCIQLQRFTYRYNIVGNVLGHPDYTWVYDNDTGTNGTTYGDRYIFVYGTPNIANGGWNSPNYAPPWASTNGPSGFEEIDTNVVFTLLKKSNYNYFDDAVPTAEGIGSTNLVDSYYLSEKPSWFYSLDWPPISPTDSAFVANPNAAVIPAGYLEIYGTNPPAQAAYSGPPTSSSSSSGAGPRGRGRR